MNQQIIGYTTGSFDVPHEHHMSILKFMKSYCDVLIVGLTSDELMIKQKRKPIFSYEQRRTILINCKHVDNVIMHTGDTKEIAYQKLQFNILFIGQDYYGKDEYKENPNYRIIFIPDVFPVEHSTDLIQRIDNEYINERTSVFKFGINGPLLKIHQLSSTNANPRDVVIKPVNVGLTEYQKGTSNAYRFTFPLPRNWKQKNAVHGNLNISGINAYREIEICRYLKEFSWNIIENVKQVYVNHEMSKQIQPVHNWSHVNLERSQPKALYWIFQRFGGDTLYEYIFRENNTMNIVMKTIERVAQIIIELTMSGIVHGDIHSKNICINSKGEVSIIDWGWCMYREFELDQDERTYYQHCLKNYFDWSHFVNSLAVDFENNDMVWKQQIKPQIDTLTNTYFQC